MTILTLFHALLVQNAPAPIRVAPETLAWLANGNDDTRRAAEAFLGKVAKSDTVAPKYAAILASKDLAAKDQGESSARAARQLTVASAKAPVASTLLSVERKTARRTILANGDVLYDFSLSSVLLTPVSFEDGFADEKAAAEILIKVVLSKLRIPKASRSLATANIRSVSLPSGRLIWGGVLAFGHAPDASGVYHISDPKWHDAVEVWTDGRVMWIQYGRDDTVMRSANGNPGP